MHLKMAKADKDTLADLERLNVQTVHLNKKSNLPSPQVQTLLSFCMSSIRRYMQIDKERKTSKSQFMLRGERQLRQDTVTTDLYHSSNLLLLLLLGI